MNRIVQLLIFTCLYSLVTFVFAHGKSIHSADEWDEGSATYLGNEAVMVQLADKKVLFDPFFHNDFGVYQLVPESIKSNLHKGIAPYDGVDMILISHAHGDHFAAKEVLAYLQKHQQVLLVGPKQAVEALVKLSPKQAVNKRLYSIDLSLNQRASTVDAAGIIVESVRIPHAGWPDRAEIENLVYRVSLSSQQSKKSDNNNNGIATVMHMGDADPNNSHFIVHQSHWNNKRTDIAFPPYWFFESKEGQAVLSKTVNASQSIGVHVPKNVPEQLKQSGFDYFSVPGETRVIIERQKINSISTKQHSKKQKR